MTLGDESEVMDRWWHPKKGEVVFDVGCASGIWSIPAMQKGAFVYAFDPDPTARWGFRENARQWGFGPGNYCIFDVAIGAENNNYWSIKKAWSEMGVPLSVMREYLKRLRSEYVILKTLDHFAGMETKLDWIKIDVEGFELAVVVGGMKSLHEYHPKLIIENHSNIDHIGPYAKERWPKLVAILEGLGYETSEMPYGNKSSHLYAEHKT